MRRFVKGLIFFVVIALFFADSAWAKATDPLVDVLKKVDKLVCKNPKGIARYYGKSLVIMSDDKRLTLDGRIEDYERMIATYERMKCDFTRNVLGGAVSGDLGYVMIDEIISVKSRLSTDERQHGFCNYVFSKESGSWKVVLEQCVSMPDYTIDPGQDALYYFHNPVY